MFTCLTIRLFIGWVGRKLLTIGLSGIPARGDRAAERVLDFKLLITLNCSLDTVIGFLKTIQVTVSCNGGVVNEPS